MAAGPGASGRNLVIRIALTLVAIIVVAVPLLAFDLSAAEVASLLGYELLAVALPGWLFYLVLTPTPGGLLRQAAFAWPAGFMLELVAFNLTAALDVRDLLVPVIAAITLALLALPRVRRRVIEAIGELRLEARSPVSPWAFVGLGVLTALMALLAAGFFLTTPLIGDADTVVYNGDAVFQVSIVAEAVNHWPIENPNVAGESLRYHTFGYMHMAAVHQVTGVEVSTIVFRSFLLAPLIASLLLLVQLGKSAGGRRAIGLLAAGLVFLVGELDIDAYRESLFGNTLFSDLWNSPTQTFGMPMFLASAVLIVESVARRERAIRPSWVLLALMLFGAAGSKASILPVLLAGLALFVAWKRIRSRRWSTPALRTLGLAFAVFVLSYVLLYAGAGSGDGVFSITPFQFADYTIFAPDVPAVGALEHFAQRAGPAPLWLTGMLVPLAGIPFLVLRRRTLSTEELVLAGFLLAGLAALLATEHPGGSQVYFLWFGFVSGSVLSAIGIFAAVKRIRSDRITPAAIAGLGMGIAFAAIFGVTTASGVQMYEESSLGHIYLIFFEIAIFVALMLAWKYRARARTGFTVSVVLAGSLLGGGALDATIDRIAVPALLTPPGAPNYRVPTPPGEHGLSLQLGEALRWLRASSDPDDVIAVNNQITGGSLDPTSQSSARYFYYAALAERRTYIGGWGYSAAAFTTDPAEIPFEDRMRINEMIFDPSDCAELERAVDESGAAFAVYDSFNQIGPDGLRDRLDPVFENGSARIYELDDVASACRP